MNYKTPVEIAKSACVVANTKANNPPFVTSVMGFLAGAYIAFGGFFMTTVSQDSALYCGTGITKLLCGLVFALGLLLVVVAGGELFTGNCLMPIGTMTGCVPMSKVIKNWVIVYFTNMAGALFITVMIYYTGLLSGPIGVNALKIAALKANLPFTQALIRGIFCNWLVAMGVWLSYSALDITGKYICCLVPVSAFVAMSFEHSVANMYFIPLGLLLKNGNPEVVETAALAADKLAGLSMSGFIQNLIPVTIGNIIGGAIFISGFYFLAFKDSLCEKSK